MKASRKVGKFLVTAILFLGIFCMVVKLGVYVVFFGAIYVTVEILRRLR